MSEFNLHRNPHGCWEWEFQNDTYGTDPQGNGIWRRLTVPVPRSFFFHGQYQPGATVIQEWEMIVDRALFHMPADRTGAVNHLMTYYGV